jgi:hypothetical protein
MGERLQPMTVVLPPAVLAQTKQEAARAGITLSHYVAKVMQAQRADGVRTA